MADQISAIGNRLAEHYVQLNCIYESNENMLDGKLNQNSWDDWDRIGFNQWRTGNREKVLSMQQINFPLAPFSHKVARLRDDDSRQFRLFKI